MEFLTLAGFLLIAWSAEVGLEQIWQEIRARGSDLASVLARPECFKLLEKIAVIAAVDGHIDSAEVKGIQMIGGALSLPSNLADVAVRDLKGATGEHHQFA